MTHTCTERFKHPFDASDVSVRAACDWTVLLSVQSLYCHCMKLEWYRRDAEHTQKRVHTCIKTNKSAGDHLFYTCPDGVYLRFAEGVGAGSVTFLCSLYDALESIFVRV